MGMEKELCTCACPIPLALCPGVPSILHVENGQSTDLRNAEFRGPRTGPAKGNTCPAPETPGPLQPGCLFPSIRPDESGSLRLRISFPYKRSAPTLQTSRPPSSALPLVPLHSTHPTAAETDAPST